MEGVQRLGPYQIVRKLGTGGCAEVFLARGPTPQGEAELALKLILPHLAEDEGHRAMLLREAKMVMPLRHPNVVEVYEVGELDGRTYLALEYLSGWPLSAFIRALRDAKVELGLTEASHLVREAALGLHHAHEATDAANVPLGIVHRDVSPHNLMLSRDGHLKVVDFGLARATNSGATQTGGLKGKLRYMPPEQLRSEPLDRRVDVFALGAILWDLALGTPLHPGPNEADIFQQALFLPQPHPDEVASGLPRAFVDLLQRAVARELPKRFASAQELADALAPFVTADAAANVAALAKALLAAKGPAPRMSREEVPAWDAPPSTLPNTTSDPRVGPKPPRTRAANVPSAKRTPANAPFLPPPREQLAGPSGPLPEEPITVPTRRREEEDEPSTTAADALPHHGLLRKMGPFVVVALLAAAGIAFVLRGFGVLSGESLWPARPSSQAAQPAGAIPGATKHEDRDSTIVDPSPPPRATHGTLVLTSDRPALARIRSKDLGMTPLTVRLTSGKHRIALESLDGAHRATVEVEVPKTGTLKRHVALGAK